MPPGLHIQLALISHKCPVRPVFYRDSSFCAEHILFGYHEILTA